MYRKLLTITTLLLSCFIFTVNAYAYTLASNIFVQNGDIDQADAFNGTYVVNVQDKTYGIYNMVTKSIVTGYSNVNLTNIFCNPSTNPPPPGLGPLTELPECNNAPFLVNTRIRYDHYNNRWIMATLPENYYTTLVAVSETSNPTGPWYTYSIQSCGFDFPVIGITKNYFYLTSDFCQTPVPSSSVGILNPYNIPYSAWQISLSALESGQPLNKCVNGNMWNIDTPEGSGDTPVSDTSTTLHPTDDNLYTISYTSSGGHIGIDIGQLTDNHVYTDNWKDVYNTSTSEAGGPPYIFDIPPPVTGTVIAGCTPSTGINCLTTQGSNTISTNGAHVAGDSANDGWIVTGFPFTPASGPKYPVVLFAVPDANNTESSITTAFQPAGEPMALTVAPSINANNEVIIGAVETSTSFYPRLDAYVWNLTTNTVSGPTIVVTGTVQPAAAVIAGYRYLEYEDCPDYGQVTGTNTFYGLVCGDVSNNCSTSVPNNNCSAAPIGSLNVGFVSTP